MFVHFIIVISLIIERYVVMFKSDESIFIYTSIGPLQDYEL